MAKAKTKVRAISRAADKKPTVTTDTGLTDQRLQREKILLESIEKKFGPNLISRASAVGYRSIPRFPTGVFALDVALGGGWAKGRMNLIWGPQSSCKTLLMLKMIMHAQQMDFFTNKYLWQVESGRAYKIAYVDVEGALDLVWAEKLGVDLESLYYVRPENAEQAAQVLESLLASGVFDIVVLDSLAAMTPEKEIDGEMGDTHVGTHARLNNQMFRKIQSTMNRIHNEDQSLTPTFFIINQEREKIGVFFGSNKVKTGGKGQDFYTTMEVHSYASKMEYFDPEEKTLPKWAHFGFKVEKNKAAPPKVEGKFILAVADDPDGAFAGGDIMEDATIMHYAERLGIFKKLDASTWEMCGKSYKRKGDLIADWFQDAENNVKLKQQILNILFPMVFNVGVQKEGTERGSTEDLATKESPDRVEPQNSITA
jgi:recombination protein RecA